MPDQPFVSQTWAKGLSLTQPIWALDVISMDLRHDVQESGITGDIELWENTETGAKGFFIGDTSNLDPHWVKLATL